MVGERADGLQSGERASQLHTTLDGGTWRGVASASTSGLDGSDGSDGFDGAGCFVDLDTTRRHGCESPFVSPVLGVLR